MQQKRTECNPSLQICWKDPFTVWLSYCPNWMQISKFYTHLKSFTPVQLNFSENCLLLSRWKTGLHFCWLAV